MSGRVAIVLHEPTVGGASLAVLNPLAALEHDGWEFCFWVPRPSPIADLLEHRGYLVAGEPRKLRYSRAALRQPPGTLARASSVPGYLARFRRFINATQPDLVHVNTVVALPEALVARSTGVPTLLNVHEMLRGPRGAAAATLARLVDGVVTDSHACAEPLLARGAHVEVVTPCIAPISDAERPPAPLARERLVVGTLATISERKGSDVFVEAAGAILERRADVEFRMVGRLADGADEPWARDVVARGERRGVRWGQTSQPYSELLDWDVFTLPTRADPFPLIVMQAMAAGLPVVASSVDGVREQVDAASGILVAPDDPAALASAIERLLDDPALRTAMGRAGAARIATTFAPERQASELVSAYQNVISRGSRRRRPRGPRSESAPAIVRVRDRNAADGDLKPMSRPTLLPPRPLRLLARRAMIAAQPALRHSGLSARVGRELERRRAVITEPEPELGPDGLPIPPPLLRVENVNTTDLDYFFERGEAAAKAFAVVSERHGLPIAEVSKLLDFGCGCGRVLRHWAPYSGLEPWGSDLNVPATEWIEANLPFAHARANGLQPPLPHGDGTFDLIYAISVFTHLPLEIGEAWMAEMHRLLRPGGLLMFTVHHDHYVPQLTRRERAAYERGEYVVQFAEAAGANICCSYHPRTYLEQLTSDFDFLEFMPPEQAPFLPQDLCIVRRPADG
ncbi:MAG: hypothetical protein QOJ63_2229 [Solirubrobacteraceae bacterium]|nr:hypothetical protein [Solirubrobacteraceae bacterium]